MQREHGPVIPVTHGQVDALLRPERLQFRFSDHRIGSHPEACLQQVERFFVGGTSLSGGVSLLLAHGIPGRVWKLSVLDFAGL